MSVRETKLHVTENPRVGTVKTTGCRVLTAECRLARSSPHLRQKRNRQHLQWTAQTGY